MVTMTRTSGTSASPVVPILSGPTASGKTALALEVAEKFGGIELINADSLCIYREMDIGTAKPTREERSRVPHHLVDIRNPSEEFTAGDFVREVKTAVESIQARGKRALIVGGTGFYLKALRFGLWDAPPADPELRKALEALPLAELHRELAEKDPASAQRIGATDLYRLVRAVEILRLSGKTPSELQAQAPSEPSPNFPLWVIDRTAEELDARILLRSDALLRAGLLEETRSLSERFPGARPLKSVGYAECVLYLAGQSPAGRTIAPGVAGLRGEITLATRQLARRQRKWFRNQKPEKRFQLDQDHSALLQELRAWFENPNAR
jgi:tRNA dimethylallyltransferase